MSTWSASLRDWASLGLPWKRDAQRKAEEAAALEEARRRRRARNEHNFRATGLVVVASGAAAMVSALLCRRSVVARRYIPRQFNPNHLPPQFNPMKDAARAVGDATLLCTTFFAFGLSSAFWLFGVSNLQEFGRAMVATYGPRGPPAPVDAESQLAEDELKKWLSK